MSNTKIRNKNPNAITGVQYVFGLADGFYSTQCQGNIDAPEFTFTGSTVENVLDYGVNDSLTGRYAIANIIPRQF